MLAVPMKTFWRITKLLGDYPWLVFVGFSTALLQTPQR